jgi:hypothetical protein
MSAGIVNMGLTTADCSDAQSELNNFISRVMQPAEFIEEVPEAHVIHTIT